MPISARYDDIQRRFPARHFMRCTPPTARRGSRHLPAYVRPRLQRSRGRASRIVSLIAVASTGWRPPFPQPVPLTTDVVEHRLGAAEVRRDPRPIARTLFEDAAPDQLPLNLG